jgi:iron complex transport system permease protein
MLRSERSLREEKETGKGKPVGERLTGLPGSEGRERTRRAAGQNAEEMELPMEHGRAGSFHEENFRRRSRYTLVFVLLAAAFCAIIILNINTGNVNIPLGRILQIIFTRSGSVDEINIVWKIRLPRILMSAILGGALALSGFLLQTFFENPIAGPFVLGISSGAKMAVAIVMIYFIDMFGKVPSVILILAAFVGAMVSTGFILLVSRAVHQMAALLVAGIMIGYICSAITEFAITFAEDSDIVNLHSWSQGSFSGSNWENVGFAAAVIGITVALTFLLSKPIGAYQLGEHYAQSMGVNVKRFRVALILISSVLSATVTAFAGPISFVGIAVPFLMKRALGTSRPLVVIPASFFGGAVFCMFCDLIARMAFAPTELNISTVTSVLGAPVVIYMLVHRQKNR